MAEDAVVEKPERKADKPDNKEKSGMKRDELPDDDRAKQQHVSKWQDTILADKKHWEADFKRMREDMQIAYAGAEDKWVDAGNYVVPIVARHINQSVATLYAKNPTVIAEPKKRIHNVVWDGRPDTLNQALQQMMSAMSPPPTGELEQAMMIVSQHIEQMGDPTLAAAAALVAEHVKAPTAEVSPEAMAIIEEAQNIQQLHLMLGKVCQTLEIVVKHFLDMQTPNFKKQLKQLVRRTKTCGVGYIYVGFQRLTDTRPDISARMEDLTAQIRRLETLEADNKDGLIEEDSAELEELRLQKQTLLEQAGDMIIAEGPVFEFPRATEIIPSRRIRQLDGFLAGKHLTREFMLTVDEVKDTYKVDVSEGYHPYMKTVSNKKSKMVAYSRADKGQVTKDNKDNYVCVWEVFDKDGGQTFTLADGYNGYLKEPKSPKPLLPGFYQIFTLTFNDVEHEDKMYPLSDVHMLKHTQEEYNRSRQLRREHRRANRPFYVSIKGRLLPEEKNKLQNRQSFDVIELNNLNPGEDINKLLQIPKPAPIDPAMYETNSEMEDVFRIVGAQEVTLGGTSGATATEVSVGEQAQNASQSSNVDDLDELLTEVVRAVAQMCLMELSEETVKEIAGPGAQWPQLSREQIIKQVDISIKAGSSGRPNRSAELANLERGMPYILQMNGVSIDPFATKYIDLLDLAISPEEALIEGMPSQVALNAMASKMQSAAGGAEGSGMTGQGMSGGGNAKQMDRGNEGPQAAYPAAGPGIS